MKKVLLIIFSLFFFSPLFAQSPCYKAAVKNGIDQYNQGKYKSARTFFNDAKQCPDPNIAEADGWIKKCNEKLKEQADKNKEAEAAKTAYMNILRVDFCNVENGKLLDDYGATLYPSKMKELQPRLTYDAILKETRNATLTIKIYNPFGALSGTYSANVRVAPGNGNTFVLPTWKNNGIAFSVGKYEYQIWYKDSKLFTSYFVITEDVPVAPEPIVIEPVEMKAEIVVLDNYGLPIEGAKLKVDGTSLYELTNSEGVGRIDLSDASPKRIEVSHKSYKDKKNILVYTGDRREVILTKSQKNEQMGLQIAQYAVPGFYQIKTDRTIEGIAFMGGEALCLFSGLISNAAAKKQLKIMQNDNVTLPDFQSAKRKYKTHRAFNIVSYTSAALIYGAHLYRTYTLSNKYGSLSMSPSMMFVGDEMAVGLNINITF